MSGRSTGISHTLDHQEPSPLRSGDLKEGKNWRVLSWAPTSPAAAEALLSSVPRDFRTPIQCFSGCLPHPRRCVVLEPSPFCTKGRSRALAKRIFVLCSELFPLNTSFPLTWRQRPRERQKENRKKSQRERGRVCTRSQNLNKPTHTTGEWRANIAAPEQAERAQLPARHQKTRKRASSRWRERLRNWLY